MIVRPHTNVDDKPMHSSGTLCCSTWFVYIVGTLQIGAYIAPISRTHSMRTAGFHRSYRPFDRDSALQRQPSTACRMGDVEQ